MDQENIYAPSTDTRDIGKALVISFHEQFAQNQNHHQKLFLQVLVVLLSVLTGFAYLYVRVDTKSSEISVKMDTLYYYVILSMFLLSMAISLICNMALGFRRDQLMAANIRVITGVMDPKSNDGYFFKSFNPQGKTEILKWMPEFHLIFFIALIATKPLLALSVVFYPCRPFLEAYACSKGQLIGVTIVAVLSIIVDIWGWFHYRGKWRMYSDQAPARLKV